MIKYDLKFINVLLKYLFKRRQQNQSNTVNLTGIVFHKVITCVYTFLEYETLIYYTIIFECESDGDEDCRKGYTVLIKLLQGFNELWMKSADIITDG